MLVTISRDTVTSHLRTPSVRFSCHSKSHHNIHTPSVRALIPLTNLITTLIHHRFGLSYNSQISSQCSYTISSVLIPPTTLHPMWSACRVRFYYTHHITHPSATRYSFYSTTTLNISATHIQFYYIHHLNILPSCPISLVASFPCCPS
jgi:hypothetical protein